MKTFVDLLESHALFESSSFKEAEKTLNKMHKFQLEIQDLQRVLLDLYGKLGRENITSKELEKVEKSIQNILEKKKEIESEVQEEKMKLQRSLITLDHYDDVEQFF
jgi:hypothetical protein